ncbi:hypothetical protein ACFQZC_26595 [Streptacidiphilus monticola]
MAVDTTANTSSYAQIRTYDSNLRPSGTGVTVTAVPGSGSVPSCSFPAYPNL